MKFSTERLILRTITEYDAQDIFEIRNNTEVNKYIGREISLNSFAALEFIFNIIRKSTNQEIVFLGISFQNQHKLIGTICLWNFSEDRKSAELGYELLPEYHRKGIMSEAVKFMIGYGFIVLKLKAIIAKTNKDNLNSIHLLHKFSFTLNNKKVDAGFPNNLIFEKSK